MVKTTEIETRHGTVILHYDYDSGGGRVESGDGSLAASFDQLDVKETNVGGGDISRLWFRKNGEVTTSLLVDGGNTALLLGKCEWAPGIEVNDRRPATV